MAWEALRAVASDEVRDSVLVSPFPASALVACAGLRARLWTAESTPAARALAGLMRAAPVKGGEVDRLVPEYLARHAITRLDAVAMVVRDHFASVSAWAFIRNTGAMVDLSGALHCLSTAVDYVGARDDGGGDGFAAYAAGIAEGLAYLAGPAADQALREAVVVGACMNAKAAMTATARKIADPQAFVETCGGPVTPHEFMWARWWEAEMVPFYRIAFANAGYRHLVDQRGVFTSYLRCGNIKRAVDNIIRTDEIPDLVFDCVNEESFNEGLVAVANGGPGAVLGYGDAVARVTDDTLACTCGVTGHQEAAEVAMGDVLWYFLHPRWQLRKQWQAYSAISGACREAFGWRSPGTRLAAVARIRVLPGDMMHTDAWQPLWTLAPAPSGTPSAVWADQLAAQAVRRCIADRAAADSGRDCHRAASSVLAACDAAPDSAELLRLSVGWEHYFDTVITAAAPRTRQMPVTSELRALIGRIWRQDMIGDVSLTSELRADERLFMDVDHAIRRTYGLDPPDGHAVRRAFIGTATSAMELSGLNPYARLSDGFARTLGTEGDAA